MASLQPTVEDYHSDASEGVSFAGRKSPNAANVSTKRSHPSDLDKEKPPAQERASPNSDIRSDSGYSSFTAATVSSADSAPSASAPANTIPQSQSPAPKTRRPTVNADQRQHSSSPRPKTVSRNPSQSSRRPPTHRRPTVTQDPRGLREDDCNDPTCTSCGPNALPRRRPDLPSTQSARDISMVPNARSMRPDPTTYYNSPPSPTYTRQQQYMQGPAVVQPTPRRRPSSAQRPRPMSYGGEHGPQYWSQGMPAPYPSPPQERGPPPAASAAYRNMQYHQMPYMVAQPQANGFYPPGFPANQTSPPYDPPQRPGLSNRNSSNYGTRNQPAPIVTQDRQPVYSARYAAPQSATQSRFPPLQIDTEAYESSETESSSGEEEEYDEPEPRPPRALMPPPKIKQRSQSQKRRPVLPHASTAPVVEHLNRRQSIVVPERVERIPERMDRRQSIVIPERTERERPQRPDRPERRQSVVMPEYRSERPERPQRPEQMERRQSIVVNDRPKDRERPPRVSDASVRRQSTSRPAPLQRQTQSYDTPSARVMVNNTKANRRSSSQIYNKMYENYAENQKAMEERYAREKALEMQMAQLKILEEAEARAREDQLKLEQKRKQRTSKAIYQVPKVFESEEESEGESESEEEEERPTPLRNGRRRPTEVDNRKGKERIVEPKVNAAEDYISAQRGAQNPYADQIHRAAKRGSHIHSERPSDESSRSNGSDKQSLSARTVTTSNGGNEIRLRVDASAPLSLSFNGDMEGRTLHLVPVENGMADIVIGNARGESQYHGSERGGSIMGARPRAIMPSQARRDPEEMTERSSRSGRSRRDGREREIRDDRDVPRQPLRRRAEYRN